MTVSKHSDNTARRAFHYMSAPVVALLLVSPALADPTPSAAPMNRHASLNFNGVPGLIDMPSAYSMPDGEMAATVSSFAGYTRATLNWQITPRLSGAFRYSVFQNVNRSGFQDYYDRSFDLRYQLAFEGQYMPAISVGLQDFAGTGLYSGEYIVASKAITPDLTVTGGLGWGRYGTYQPLSSPFGARPGVNIGQGGTLSTNTWFRGPMAAFGGVEWRPSDKLRLKLEYSSDDYAFEAGTRGLFKRKSPINLGVEYQVNDALRLGAYSLYGDTIGIAASLSMNPRRATTPRIDRAPSPIAPRPSRLQFPDVYSSDWVGSETQRASIESSLKTALEPEGQVVLGLDLKPDTATIWVDNERHIEPAGAAGRIARVLAFGLPASVETFRIVMVKNGVPVSTLQLNRSDLERLETEPNRAEALLAGAGFGEAPPLTAANQIGGAFPRFDWRISPYTRTSYFDPQNPLLFELGARASARYEPTPGLVAQGTIEAGLASNFDRARLSTGTALPAVRTDWANFYQPGEVRLRDATLSYSRNLGKGFYGRLTVGYLEQMYGGVSAEVLWKPVDSRLGLGVEVNHVRKRDPNDMFGFGTYEITTGHASAYYEMENGYHGQLDVGRYLAGDIGATLTLSREFANGWKVSAFATMTDVSAADFGEGSFDKGISFEIPLGWATGSPSQRTIGHTIRPVQRDGGARLNVRDRLYETVRSADSERYEDGWPLVWR